MAWLHAHEVNKKHGPCRLMNAHGDFLLGSITECNLESGEYVVMNRGDDGRPLFSEGGYMKYERCQDAPPLRLVPLEGHS